VRRDEGRALTPDEVALCRTMFGDAIDYAQVRVHHQPWFPLQPRYVVMAPDGHIWCHPKGSAWRKDYTFARPALQEVFIHEMTHVWQAQRSGRWFLPLARHPFCRYRYRLKPGKPFHRYGIEQQAEIVAHAFRARQAGKPDTALEALLPF
jgi:hypothetical protein